MHNKVHPSILVHFSIQGNHPVFLFVDCCFDITLNKHSNMIANTLDELSLDDNTVIVSYKQV